MILSGCRMKGFSGLGLWDFQGAMVSGSRP